MSKSSRTRLTFWSTPVVSVLGGVAYLVAAWHSGQRNLGFELLGIMVVFAVLIVLAGRWSETVRGLLDQRDERITSIDLRATAIAGLALIVAVIVGGIAELAHGHSGAPYTWLAAVGGVAYLAAVVVQHVRG